MVEIAVYNSAGEKVGTEAVSPEVFGVPVKESVVHQVMTALLSNRRVPVAHTKGRAEVRGGGKKPWRQKGTGRARHGSIRSPLWRGGGVTFGPLNIRNFKKKVNKKVNRLAMRMVLSDKAAQSHIVVVEDLQGAEGKTKALYQTLLNVFSGALGGRQKEIPHSALIVTDAIPEELRRAVRNIPRVHTCTAGNVNVVDVLQHAYVFATREGVRALEKRLQDTK